MIWATLSLRSCFCRLYRASLSLAEKNIINLISDGIDHLVMSICRIFSCVVGRGCLLWPVHSLGKTLLAFALLHSVLQGQDQTHTHTQTKCFCILYIYLFHFILLVQSCICSFFFPISYYTVAVAQPTFDTTKIRKLLVPLIGHMASISTFSGNGY